MDAVTRVPSPGREVIVRSPPHGGQPVPHAGEAEPAGDVVWIEARAVAAHLHPDRFVVRQLNHHSRRAGRVLRRVLESFEAAEVGGALGLA